MADLATEPRWGRINGTFGEDAELGVAAGRRLYPRLPGRASSARESVACMTKHFPGGGPQKDGEDPHFPYGREQVYPGDNFEYHLIPFEAAFAAGTGQIMPYYGMPIGTGAGGGRLRVQPGRAHRLAARADTASTASSAPTGGCSPTRCSSDRSAGARLGRRAPERRRARAEGAGRGRRPVRRRGLPRGDRRAGTRAAASPRRASTSRRAGCCATSFASACSTTAYVDPEAAERIVGSEAFRAAGEAARSAARSCCSRPATACCPLPLRGRGSTLRTSTRRCAE